MLNGLYNTFIYRKIFAQHLLNKPLAKREINNRVLFLSQLLFSIVEILLRVYIVSIVISLFINSTKKRMILQGFKLFPRDRIETTDPFYRLIPTLPIVVELVGGIGQSVGCRRKFPTLLQHLSDLVLLHFYLRVYQQQKNVVVAERECVRADTIHDVKYQLVHLYLQSVTVAADYLLQGFGMQQRWSKPHTAFLFGG